MFARFNCNAWYTYCFTYRTTIRNSVAIITTELHVRPLWGSTSYSRRKERTLCVTGGQRQLPREIGACNNGLSAKNRPTRDGSGQELGLRGKRARDVGVLRGNTCNFRALIASSANFRNDALVARDACVAYIYLPVGIRRPGKQVFRSAIRIYLISSLNAAS